NMFVLDPVCKTCRWGIPYAGLAQQMEQAGVVETATIVTVDKELGGNLRRYFPQAAIVMRLYPRFTPDDADLQGDQVVFIWPQGHKKLPMTGIKAHITPMLPQSMSMSDAVVLSVPWDHLWRDSGYRTSKWQMLVVDR
ncbi:MAG: hypothetical protein AAFV69_08055, partial [Pseudomonadota bacterium]